MASSRRLAAIVFTDIVGFTPLTQSDEAAALRLLEAQERIVRPLLESHRGRKVKSIGDGQLLEFRNALDAVEFSVALQRAAHERGEPHGAPALRLRVGIHLGDVQRKGSDILGDAVNLAARIEPLADPGGIDLTAQVFEQVRRKVPYQLESVGVRTLKGVAEPVEIYRVSLPWSEPAPAAAPAGPPRLAVLPFANISPDPNDGYFADGLTEELISVLSQIRGLRVIARTSVGQYKDTTKPIGQIGSELGVSSVLEGSVRKAGDHLRITVQLIDVGTEEHRWAQTYERKLENVFAIQAEVAERTAGALQVELLRPEREAIGGRPTKSLAAYEAYLRGLTAYHQRALVTEPYTKAKECFEEAIRQDPEFTAAYAYLANILIGELGQLQSRADVVPRARELVERALELNPNSSDAHTAAGNLALQADLDWPRAEEEFRRAIALNPSSSTARFWYGFLLGALQRPEEARRQFEATVELDPLWLVGRANLVGSLGILGEHERAITLGRSTLAMAPDFAFLHVQLAFALLLAGQFDEAGHEAQLLKSETSLYARQTRGLLLAWLGHPEEARALLKEFESHSATAYVSIPLVAAIYAELGDAEHALSLLERDARRGDRLFWSYYQLPAFDPLREDPRFVAILRGMNLPTGPPKRPRVPRPIRPAKLDG